MKSLAVLLLMSIVACSSPQTTNDAAPSGGNPSPSANNPSATPPVADATIVETPVDTTAAPPPATSGSTPAVNITIDDVQIANPLTISGRARTFENHVALRVRGADGRVVAEGFTTATGEIGHHNPYRAELFLTQDPGARVTVEALEHSARDGSEQSLVRVQRPFNVERISMRLFYPDASCTGVKPYTRRVPKSISMARLAVEALLAGPTAEEKRAGATTPFPRDSRLESVNLREGTLIVDFNERLRNVGGSCAAGMIRASVTETLRQLPAVKKVVITAAGSEALALQP